MSSSKLLVFKLRKQAKNIVLSTKFELEQIIANCELAFSSIKDKL